MNQLKSLTRLLGVLVVVSLPSWAGIVFQDDFQNYNGGTNFTSLTKIGDGAPTWQVVANTSTNPTYTGNVDLVGVTVFNNLCGTAGNQCVDLAGSGQGANGIPSAAYFQTANLYTLSANQVYLFSFQLAGSLRGYPTNHVVFGIKDGSGNVLYSDQVYLPPDQPLTHYAFTYAPGAASKQFRLFFDNSDNVGVNGFNPPQNNPGYYGALLDNVMVTDVPEPATLGLTGILLALGGATLRRRRAC